MATEEPGGLRSGFATVTIGTLFLLIATFLLVGFTFLARVLITRGISRDAFNAFSFDYALLQVLLAVATYGITVAVARSLPYARTEPERRTIVRTGTMLGAGAAIASGLALFVASSAIGRWVGSSQVGVGLEIGALALACLIVASVLASVFQGLANVTPNALFLQIVNPGLFLVFLATVLVLPPRTLTFTSTMLSFAAACLVTLAAVAVYALRRLPPGLLQGPGERSVRRQLVRLSAPLFVYGTMVSIAGLGDTLVLGAIHFAQVGTYSASLTVARLIQVGISAASYIFLPVASAFLARGNRRAVGLTYATITKWLTLLSLPLTIVFVFLPSASLNFVYGAKYANVILPLQIVVLGAFVGTLLGPAAMAQVAVGQARLLAVNATVAGITDLALAVALVPAYGEVGAAVAWSVANVLYFSLCLAELNAREHFHPFGRDFVVPLAATALPVGAVLALWHPRVPLLALPALAVGVAVLYVVAILATRSVDDGDRLLLDAIERLYGKPLPLVRRVARALTRSSR
ncbi:MAG TPA: polysaccharide biosynthesis C-terminal domain-containing protein [Thermoplasmata archaeon]|nr:polysaccharide biosynthesis C-terminal domain-containing protein [Thermoplasmata archaeon]